MTRRRFAVALIGLSLGIPVAAQDDPAVVIVPVNPLENPPQTLWLESLFKAPGVRYDGNLVFSPRKAVVNGQRFEHAMSADVKDDPAGPGEYCAMTIPLQGKFLRFEATVGRDEEETKTGTGFCYFEVYGDNKRLFRSDAIRSSLYRVITNEGGVKRLRPQLVDVDVKGVRLLRLVVRYANDFKQTGTFSASLSGDNVKRAAGCVWCDAKLLTGAGAALNTGLLKERDERIRTAARLAARTLKRQLRVLESPREKYGIGLLPIRDEFRVAADDLLIRPQIARVFFGDEAEDGPPLGEPIAPEKAAQLRDSLRSFTPKSLRSLAAAAEEGRYAGARYLIGGYLENEKLYLLLLDTRPDEGLIVGNATGWLSPP